MLCSWRGVRRSYRLPGCARAASSAKLGYADLRFLDDEAGEMLRIFAPSLDEDTIQEVVPGRTVGRQASSSPRSPLGRPVPGQDERPEDRENLFVSDYVWREVFAAESSELADALLDVAVVERVNPDLAMCLSGVSDARALLTDAESRGCS